MLEKFPIRNKYLGEDDLNNNSYGKIVIVYLDKNFADMLYPCPGETGQKKCAFSGPLPVSVETNAQASVKAIKHDVPDLIIADSLLIDNMKGLGS